MLRIFVSLAIILGLSTVTWGDTVTGNIVFNSNGTPTVSLPSGSILEIEILDTRLADAAARILATVQVPVTGSFPISYQITYTPDTPPLPFYTLSASIKNGNNLLYRNTNSITTTAQEDGTDVVNIPVDSMI